MANEAIHSWHRLNSSTKNLQLSLVSSSHCGRERIYGRLKSRWQRLMKRNDMSIENIPNIVTAACILHNVCKIHGESFNEA